jgi:acetyl-CoA carboxylase biotin carboxyl carrier protein
MDIRKIRKLIELIEETGVAEIEIKEGEEGVRISRHATFSPPQTIQLPPVHSPMPAPTPAAKPAEAAQSTPHHEIKSPMVGTFYSSPAPGAPAFTSAGQHVEKGDVLCVVEAMKMFNQIEADSSGKIIRCLIDNGEPVEYGETLFLIEKE